jgi:hypothetical protein
MRIFRCLFAALAAALWLVTSPPAAACAVCFGRTDSPLGKGLHWGVFALLVFVFLMLSSLAAFAVFLARRSAAVEAEQEALSVESGSPR